MEETDAVPSTPLGPLHPCGADDAADDAPMPDAAASDADVEAKVTLMPPDRLARLQAMISGMLGGRK